MEITKKMNVPADFLYKTIIDSVLHDIKQATAILNSFIKIVMPP